MNANIRPSTAVAGRAEVGRAEAYDKGAATGRSEHLAARLEPFDSYWQAPKDVEKGFTSFTAYYRANYLGHMPADKQARILVISCGPGYLVKMLRDCGYTSVLGIDSDAAKVDVARRHQLPCEVARAFEFLAPQARRVRRHHSGAGAEPFDAR